MNMPNPLISQVTLPNGTTYDIKDGWSRTEIAHIKELIEAGMHYIGSIADGAANQIEDGSTKNPVTIKGSGSTTKSVTAISGDIVTQGADEFIFDGTAWHEFGDLSELGTMAFVDTASGPFTPAGTVSKPTFTGSQSTVTITATDNTSGNYQPKGTVSQPTFSGTKVKISGTVTPTGSVSGSFSGTPVRLVTGNISVPTSASTTTASTENKTATVSAASSGEATYTPSGQVSGTAVEMNTTSVKSITAVGTLPQWTASVPSGTENLTFSWSAGTLPTKGAAQTVATTVKSVTDPTFTGDGARLVTGNIAVPKSYTTTFTNTNKTAAVSVASSGEATYTPSGSVSGTFTGESDTVAITVAADANGNYTPAGTVSKPTFSGTKTQLSGTTTAAGSVSQPTFSGTAGTVTVTPDTP
jgi:hypothetical protein